MPSTPRSGLTTLCPTHRSHAHTVLPESLSFRPRGIHRRQCTLSKFYIIPWCHPHPTRAALVLLCICRSANITAARCAICPYCSLTLFLPLTLDPGFGVLVFAISRFWRHATHPPPNPGPTCVNEPPVNLNPEVCRNWSEPLSYVCPTHCSHSRFNTILPRAPILLYVLTGCMLLVPVL